MECVTKAENPNLPSYLEKITKGQTKALSRTGIINYKVAAFKSFETQVEALAHRRKRRYRQGRFHNGGKQPQRGGGTYPHRDTLLGFNEGCNE